MSLLISTNIYSMTLFLIFFLLIFFSLLFFCCFLFRVCQSHWEAASVAASAVGRQICGLLSCVNYLVSLPSRLLLLSLSLSPSFFVGLCTSFFADFN